MTIQIFELLLALKKNPSFPLQMAALPKITDTARCWSPKTGHTCMWSDGHICVCVLGQLCLWVAWWIFPCGVQDTPARSFGTFRIIKAFRKWSLSYLFTVVHSSLCAFVMLCVKLCVCHTVCSSHSVFVALCFIYVAYLGNTLFCTLYYIRYWIYQIVHWI